MIAILLIGLSLAVLAAFHLGRRQALSLAGNRSSALHSQPAYYGYYVALWCAAPCLALVGLWTLAVAGLSDAWILSGGIGEGRAPELAAGFIADAKRLAAGGRIAGSPSAELSAAADRYRGLQQWSDGLLLAISLSVAVAGLTFARARIHPGLRARNAVEKVATVVLFACAGVAVVVTAGIVLSLIFESLRFFSQVPLGEFLFGLAWSPQMALRADQVGSSGAFGAVPVFAGTLLITVIAMAVAVPVGLFSAIYLSEYAGPRVRAWVKPSLEILAGIPTVVYGFFAALSVAPTVRALGTWAGLDVASESALAAGAIMGIMIIPFVSSLSDDVISAVPHALREGSYALGATHSETIRQVVIPAALPGIVGAVLLAISRAIGETMIVVMAAGLAANLTANPFAAVTTVTVQIVTLLVGDQEFDSPKTLAAFALGLVLFVITLVLNVIALTVVRRYREKYD